MTWVYQASVRTAFEKNDTLQTARSRLPRSKTRKGETEFHKAHFTIMSINIEQSDQFLQTLYEITLIYEHRGAVSGTAKYEKSDDSKIL
jgi:hypothetical protein